MNCVGQANRLESCEKLTLPNPRHPNNAGEGASRYRFGPVYRNSNAEWMPLFHHHMMASFDTIKLKTQISEGPNSILT
jgi:hypothetical protein